MTTKSMKADSLKSKNQAFTYSEVLSITDNFKTIIGEGGFGKVYLGSLQDDTQVAVKLLSSSSIQGHKEFRSEVCHWLEYLHNSGKPPIIHRNMKSTNILLDENMRAKISDFGLSRAFANDKDSYISTNPAGTPGYLSSGNLNKKSDVYSFGIILHELITGQPALRSREAEAENNHHILNWVTPIIKNGDIQNVVHPRLQREFSPNTAWKIVETALACIPPAAIQRQDMSYVLTELKECLALEMAHDQNGGMNSLQLESQISEVSAR
ncbi:Receptor-like protein kinase family [Quillaja saponaria]|uniref:Receptor-like protein kinase family n=1 Tax=Quillaja saponaria TaxID=32244 RepID=A0AAD7LRW9_QUISA|nr:Receptor-like protein kinase family [Quillaja saponaria]